MSIILTIKKESAWKFETFGSGGHQLVFSPLMEEP